MTATECFLIVTDCFLTVTVCLLTVAVSWLQLTVFWLQLFPDCGWLFPDCNWLFPESSWLVSDRGWLFPECGWLLPDHADLFQPKVYPHGGWPADHECSDGGFRDIPVSGDQQELLQLCPRRHAVFASVAQQSPCNSHCQQQWVLSSCMGGRSSAQHSDRNLWNPAESDFSDV